jgi:hypothetical protein
MLHVFGVVFAWMGARQQDAHAAFGARFGVYTAIVQRPDGTPAVDVGMSIREDGSAIDRLCRFALATYEGWRVST